MKKKLRLSIVNWPSYSAMSGAAKTAHYDPYKSGGAFHRGICSLFADYEDFLRMATRAIPDRELPLLIGRDLPDFVVRMIEARLRNGKA